MMMEEFEACVSAGLDLWMWESNMYSRNFKVRVIAWYRLHNLIDSHKEAEKAKAIERMNKGKKF
jgi:hypothetical protein